MSNITFNEIANNYKVPGTYVEIADFYASQGLAGKESVGFIIGQKTSQGSGDFNRIYSVFSEDEVIKLAGVGSEVHRIAKKWFKNNGYNLLKLLFVEQTGGQTATYSCEITAENAKSGQINLLIAGQPATVDIAEGNTAAEIATALIAAINANEMMPVVASAVEGQQAQLLLTAKHKGEAYNNIPLTLNYYSGQKTAAGVKISFTASQEGSGNVSLIQALAAVGDEYFTDVITNYCDDANVRLIRQLLEERFTALRDKPATLHIGFHGTYSDYITKAAAINSMHVVLHPVCEGECMPDEFIAASAANIAYRSQVNPGLAYKNMKLIDILPSRTSFDERERNLLLNNGVSTVYRDTSGNLYLERPVTTLTKKSTGQKTENWLDVFKVKLIEYLRYSLVIYMNEKFPNFKLADDDFPIEPGMDIATPLVVKAELQAWGKMCQKAGLIERLEDVMTLRNDTDTSRIDALVRPNPIDNLMTMAIKLQPSD